MACTINDGAVLRVSVHGDVAGEDVMNVYQLQLLDGGPLELADYGEMMADWAQGLYALVKTFCNVLITFDGVFVDHLNGNCSTGFVAFDTNQVGALNTGVVPFGVAALITFNTGIKRVTPRKYFGVLDESVIDVNGLIASSFLDEMALVVGYLMSPAVISGATWVYGYQSPKTSNFELPLSGAVKREPAYQRRRRRGTGS